MSPFVYITKIITKTTGKIITKLEKVWLILLFIVLLFLGQLIFVYMGPSTADLIRATNENKKFKKMLRQTEQEIQLKNFKNAQLEAEIKRRDYLLSKIEKAFKDLSTSVFFIKNKKQRKLKLTEKLSNIKLGCSNFDIKIENLLKKTKVLSKQIKKNNEQIISLTQ